MFNFWPFNVARKRREAEDAERQKRLAEYAERLELVYEQPRTFGCHHALHTTCLNCEGMVARAKRNTVIPMDDPRHPRNLTPEQRQRIKEREAEQQATIDRERQLRLSAPHAAPYRGSAPQPSAPPADNWNSNLLNPLNLASPLNPIYQSSPAPESRCDSPSDSGSYDFGSSSCSTD